MLTKVKASMVTSTSETEDASLEAREKELETALDDVRRKIASGDADGADPTARKRPDKIQQADFMLMKRRPALANLKAELKALDGTPMELFEKNMKQKELRGQIRSIEAQVQVICYFILFVRSYD